MLSSMNEESGVARPRAVEPRPWDGWWLPLARRVVGWGLAGAALWAGLVALLLLSVIVALTMWELVFPPPPDPDGWSGLWVGVAFAAMIAIAAVFAVFGAVAGAICGFFASPFDAKTPLQSRFFRSVNRQTFWFWLATSLVCVPTIALLLLRFAPPLQGDGFMAAMVGLAFSVVLFPLALWRAVDCSGPKRKYQKRHLIGN